MRLEVDIMENSIIRSAENKDIQRIEVLLRQVHAVHAGIRPDLFIEGMQKYSGEELAKIIENEQTPVFVYEENCRVEGYVFCRIICETAPSKVKITTLYIDDLCVDKSARSKGIGRKLFDYACGFAKRIGAYNVTLHVYSGNERAERFYNSLGLAAQYTALEKIL